MNGMENFSVQCALRNIKEAVLRVFQAHNTIIQHNQVTDTFNCYKNAEYIKYNLTNLAFTHVSFVRYEVLFMNRNCSRNLS